MDEYVAVAGERPDEPKSAIRIEPQNSADRLGAVVEGRSHRLISYFHRWPQCIRRPRGGRGNQLLPLSLDFLPCCWLLRHGGRRWPIAAPQPATPTIVGPDVVRHRGIRPMGGGKSFFGHRRATSRIWEAWAGWSLSFGPDRVADVASRSRLLKRTRRRRPGGDGRNSANARVFPEAIIANLSPIDDHLGPRLHAGADVIIPEFHRSLPKG